MLAGVSLLQHIKPTDEHISVVSAAIWDWIGTCWCCYREPCTSWKNGKFPFCKVLCNANVTGSDLLTQPSQMLFLSVTYHRFPNGLLSFQWIPRILKIRGISRLAPASVVIFCVFCLYAALHHNIPHCCQTFMIKIGPLWMSLM